MFKAVTGILGVLLVLVRYMFTGNVIHNHPHGIHTGTVFWKHFVNSGNELLSENPDASCNIKFGRN